MSEAITETVTLSRVRTAFVVSTVASYIAFIVSQLAVLGLISVQSSLSPSLYFQYGHQPLASFLKALAVLGLEVAIFTGICLALPLSSHIRKTRITGVIVAGMLMIGAWGIVGLDRLITERSAGAVVVFVFQLSVGLICLYGLLRWWENKVFRIETVSPTDPIVADKATILAAAYLCAYVGLTVGGLIDTVYRLARLTGDRSGLRDIVIRGEWHVALYIWPLLAMVLLWILPARNTTLFRWAFIGCTSVFFVKQLSLLSQLGWKVEALPTLAIAIGSYMLSIWLAMFLYLWLNPDPASRIGVHSAVKPRFARHGSG